MAVEGGAVGGGRAGLEVGGGGAAADSIVGGGPVVGVPGSW